MSYSIKEKQIDVLRRMINFDQIPLANDNLNEPSWKILVYDDFGQDIITPLLSVKELRDLGVTAHLLLRSERDPIPDVPAIYFISPTAENVARLCQDLKNELYESYYLNFISPVPRSLLEDIAQAAITANCVNSIHKVFDQYLNFISLDDEIFCLRHQEKEKISFYSMNKGDVKDSEMNEIINTITDGLFSVFATLGCVPIIRCPRNNAAEVIAEKLDKKIRENLRDSRNSLFLNDAISHNGQLSFQRPVLILLDRSFDLATPLHHTWTYQALMHDLYDLKLNKVEISGATSLGAAAAPTPKKSYILLNSDKFWKQQKGNTFPVVAESIAEELEKYKQYENELKSLKNNIDDDSCQSDEAMNLMFNNTSKLTSAVSSLPELLEMKRILDMHTNIATSLLDLIKKRKLDLFFETEEKLMGKMTLEKSVMEIINDSDTGGSDDKMRLFMIYYLCSNNLSQSELDQYLLQLKTAGCDIECIKFLKRFKSISKMSYTNQVTDNSYSNSYSKFSSILSKSSKFVMEGVKNLGVKQQKLPITRITENLLEHKSSPETDDYRYFDPKLIKSDGNRSKMPINDAIVFVIGGGNYFEYQNLLENSKPKSAGASAKRILYGSTEFSNASQLIEQLTMLGREMS